MVSCDVYRWQPVAGLERMEQMLEQTPGAICSSESSGVAGVLQRLDLMEQIHTFKVIGFICIWL